jgi:hypothetical protein
MRHPVTQLGAQRAPIGIPPRRANAVTYGSFPYAAYPVPAPRVGTLEEEATERKRVRQAKSLLSQAGLFSEPASDDSWRSAWLVVLARGGKQFQTMAAKEVSTDAVKLLFHDKELRDAADAILRLDGPKALAGWLSKLVHERRPKCSEIERRQRMEAGRLAARKREAELDYKRLLLRKETLRKLTAAIKRSLAQAKRLQARVDRAREAGLLAPEEAE